MVKTKIICTLGPASWNQTTIRKMMLAGMDVVRLNFSHASHTELFNVIRLIRILNKKYRRRIKILGDLQGHRIRIGQLPAPIELKKKKIYYLAAGKKCDDRTIVFDYTGPLNVIKKGHHIFIDDGNIDLEVIANLGNRLKVKVISGGLLKSNKGVNIPNAKLKFGTLSQKDRQDIIFCQRYAVEYIAQSFVCDKNDIIQVRNVLNDKFKCDIIAKIENREGIKNIDQIIEVSDGIMIARGDMGVSMPIYEIPILQKMIIKKCNSSDKFVITATQMLESMVENPRPTRAEVSDVANAIIDGTDFVMLSAESAIGRYPVQAVKMMNNIIKFTEDYLRKIKNTPKFILYEK